MPRQKTKLAKDSPIKIEICDCTIRDGGYLNNWDFDRKAVREIYRAISKSGVDYVELGYRNLQKKSTDEKYGIWKFTPEDVLRDTTKNIHGAKISLMIDYGKLNPEEIPNKDESLVDLFRIAVHKDKVPAAIDTCEKLKRKGFKVSLNLMGYSNYSEKERKTLISLLKGLAIDYIYVADSYGAIFPDQIKEFLIPLINLPNVKIGFHPHNNLQIAFANTLEAIKCGVHIIDSSIYGMGRAAGNLPTEILVAYLESSNKDKYNIIPILDIIDKYFIALQKEIGWGYDLAYMLSGILKCHPDYPRYLSQFREFQMEDIWTALNRISKMDHVGFSKELTDEVIKHGLFNTNLDFKQNIASLNNLEVKSDTQAYLKATSEDHLSKIILERPAYIDRHRGQDFLILANGPTLKEYKKQIDAFINKFNPIILGANYLEWLFIPHYHAFNNKRRFIDYIDYVNRESKLLIGVSMPEAMIKEYTDRDYEKLIYIDRYGNDFDIQDGIISTNCKTISVLLIGVAIVMGARRIFVVGMDGYMFSDEKRMIHFYKEKDEAVTFDIIKEKHSWNLFYLEQIDKYLCDRDKDGINLLTPTTYKKFFRGIENYI